MSSPNPPLDRPDTATPPTTTVDDSTASTSTPVFEAAASTTTPAGETASPPAKRGWRSTYLGAGDDRQAANVSWGAIFGGIVTTIGVLIAFSLLGAALGFGVTDPTSDQPFEGVGVGLAIWSIVTLVLAVAVGGFVTGVLAGRAGFIHGVVTWAGGLIAAAVVVTMTTSAALGAAGSIVSSTVSAVGSGAGDAASAIGDALDGATDPIADALGEIDEQEIAQQAEDILVGTGVPELQPDFLAGQVDAAGDDIVEAGRQLLVTPEEYETIIGDLGSSLADRAETVGSAVDRDAIANSVEANTDLTGPEAQAVTDNVADGVTEAAEAAQEQLQNAEQTARELVVEVEQTIEDARQTADEISDAVAEAAGWGFAGTLIALAISAFAGLWGARLVDRTPRATRRSTEIA